VPNITRDVEKGWKRWRELLYVDIWEDQTSDINWYHLSDSVRGLRLSELSEFHPRSERSLGAEVPYWAKCHLEDCWWVDGEDDGMVMGWLAFKLDQPLKSHLSWVQPYPTSTEAGSGR
jgi:hypothetical protein